MVGLGAAISGGLGLAKMIIGGIQSIKGRGDMRKELANLPKYTRPDEYNKLLSIYQQQSGMGQLPGQAGYEAALSTRTARGARSMAKFSDSPVAAVAGTMGLYGQEQQAVRDLGLQFADYKTQAQRNLAGAYQVGMQEAGKEFSYNQFYPSQVRLNMAQQRTNAGQQNLWGGIDQMGAAAIDYFGNPAQGQGQQPNYQSPIDLYGSQAAANPSVGQVGASNYLRPMTGTTSGGIAWPNLNQIPR
jgi:hypothetical protein